MEIEKTRETSWKIQIKNKDDNISLTSVEMSGEVRVIKLTLATSDELTTIEMNKEEFYNFLSLISAFRDVVIGEDSIIFEQKFVSNDIPEDPAPIVENDDDLYQVSPEPLDIDLKKNENEELNPEEWDPW